MKRKITLLALAVGLLTALIFNDEPFIANDPLLEDPNILNVYPMAPDEEPSVIEAPEYENDLLGTHETQGLSDGTGPVVGMNKIEISIMNSPRAGSHCDFIYMDFGPDKNLRLWGYPSGKSFPKSGIISWDLSDQQKRSFMESLDQESWDYITLRATSTDGIKINRVVIVHSSEEILNWRVSDWLESPSHSHLGLASKILSTKLKKLKNPTQAAVHYGLRELGKTDGYKYGTVSLWCSEFASWCLRKDGWDTPTGSIGTTNMKNFFNSLGRLCTQSEILDGTYVPEIGDYLSLWDGQHSAIFVKWVDDPKKGINNETQFTTIEGNCGKTVRIKIRKVGDIDHVGMAR